MRNARSFYSIPHPGRFGTTSRRSASSNGSARTAGDRGPIPKPAAGRGRKRLLPMGALVVGWLMRLLPMRAASNRRTPRTAQTSLCRDEVACRRRRGTASTRPCRTRTQRPSARRAVAHAPAGSRMRAAARRRHGQCRLACPGLSKHDHRGFACLWCCQVAREKPGRSAPRQAARLEPARQALQHLLPAGDGTGQTGHGSGRAARPRQRPGGADHRAGSGLRGLADRVAATGRELTVHNPPGWGTTITADLPIHPASPADA